MKRPRPFITLKIAPGTPLSKARLPINKKEMPDGSFLVKLDPVSFAAMMSSIGQLCLVDQAVVELLALQEKIQGHEEQLDGIPQDNQIDDSSEWAKPTVDENLALPD